MKTKNHKPKIKATKRYQIQSSNVPVTQKMLFGVRDELRAHIRSEMHGVRAEIHGVKAEVHGLRADIHKLGILIEEQNARNIVVLDGLTSLFFRQDRVEAKVDQFEKILVSAK